MYCLPNIAQITIYSFEKVIKDWFDAAEYLFNPFPPMVAPVLHFFFTKKFDISKSKQFSELITLASY